MQFEIEFVGEWDESRVVLRWIIANMQPNRHGVKTVTDPQTNINDTEKKNGKKKMKNSLATN